jgi:hypothetical protein
MLPAPEREVRADWRLCMRSPHVLRPGTSACNLGSPRSQMMKGAMERLANRNHDREAGSLRRAGGSGSDR